MGSRSRSSARSRTNGKNERGTRYSRALLTQGTFRGNGNGRYVKPGSSSPGNGGEKWAVSGMTASGRLTARSGHSSGIGGLEAREAALRALGLLSVDVHSAESVANLSLSTSNFAVGAASDRG